MLKEFRNRGTLANIHLIILNLFPVITTTQILSCFTDIIRVITSLRERSSLPDNPPELRLENTSGKETIAKIGHEMRMAVRLFLHKHFIERNKQKSQNLAT